jgi:hypothetical protein
MILDAKLWWKWHINKKRYEPNMKFKKMYLVAWTQFRAVNPIKSYYASKLYIQFGVMVSSFGAVPVIECYQDKVLEVYC